MMVDSLRGAHFSIQINLTRLFENLLGFTLHAKELALQLLNFLDIELVGVRRTILERGLLRLK